MILRAIKKAKLPFLHHLGSTSHENIPYDMFDIGRTKKELKSAQILEHIYHKGQTYGWDGKKVLDMLLKKHGGVQISEEKMAPLRRIFAVIFWGELAAWKVSTELARQLVPLEAKMAASSQAHDEARHFYVMNDYLTLLDYKPQKLPPAAAKILETVLSADNLAKQLIGMQLMVEPVALTLFQVVRESHLEPVLCELLQYFERDEARHVALGVQHLPVLISEMNRREKLDLLLWQLRLFSLEIDALKEMEPDIRALGFSPKQVIKLGQTKQMHAARLLHEQSPDSIQVEELVSRIVEFRMALHFPDDLGREETFKGKLYKWKKAVHALLYSAEQSKEISKNLNNIGNEDIFSTEPKFAG